MAYDAARTLSLLVVWATGYRPRTVGAHYNTFLALEAADPLFATLSAYFDGCRMKRNSCEYDVAGGVSDTDAEGLLTTVRQFALDVEAWIKAHYPQLKCRQGEIGLVQWCALCVLAPWREKKISLTVEGHWRGHRLGFDFRGVPIESKDGITQIVKELEEDDHAKSPSRKEV